MANTYIPIATSTVGSGGAANIDIQNIPNTYTDLCLYLSVRTSSNDSVYITFNNTSTTYTGKFVEGNGTGVSGASLSDGRYVAYPLTTTTNTFASVMIYIPSYASSNNKTWFADAANEANTTTAYNDILGNMWSNTAPINRITITPSAYTLSQYTTATLYGIKNS